MNTFPVALTSRLCSLLLLAAVAHAEPPPQPAAQTIGAGAEALAQTERDFAKKSVAEGALAAWRAFFAEDAVQLPASQGPVRGREAICAWVKSAGLDEPGIVLDWWPLRAEVSQSGDLGYTFGEWEMRKKEAYAGSAAKLIARGKFTTVWKKQADGAWKVILDTGNEESGPK